MEKLDFKIFLGLVITLPLFSAYAFSSSPREKPSNLKISAERIPFKNQILVKSFQKVTSEQSSFSKKALSEAYKFLDKNYMNLQPEALCLSKDNVRNRKAIRNKSCLVIADYSKSKRVPRLLVINPQTGESELFFTAHGKGSHEKDKIKTGHMAKRFSNVEGSNMTSLGFYLTDNTYNSMKSTFGPGPRNGLKLDGLNCSNNQARKRYIVLHTADYVQPLNGDPKKMGNSAGCVTVPEHRKDVIQKCKGGALVYAYYNQEG